MRPPVSCDLQRAGRGGHTQEGAREMVPSPLLCPPELPLAGPNQDQRERKPLIKLTAQVTRVGSRSSEQRRRGKRKTENLNSGVMCPLEKLL